MIFRVAVLQSGGVRSAANLAGHREALIRESCERDSLNTRRPLCGMRVKRRTWQMAEPSGNSLVLQINALEISLVQRCTGFLILVSGTVVAT